MLLRDFLGFMGMNADGGVNQPCCSANGSAESSFSDRTSADGEERRHASSSRACEHGFKSSADCGKSMCACEFDEFHWRNLAE